MWWQEESQILGTGNFQSASDFGGLNIYPHIARGMNRLINEQRDEINVTTNAFHEPGVDVLHDTVPANALPVHIGVMPDTSLSPIVVPEQMTQTDIIPVSAPSSNSISAPPVHPISAPQAVVVSPSLHIDLDDDCAQIRLLCKSSRQSELGSVAIDVAELETCCFADWSTYELYWSWFERRL